MTTSNMQGGAPPLGRDPWVVPFISLLYKLFLAVSLVTMHYEIFLVLSSIILSITGGVIHYCEICAI